MKKIADDVFYVGVNDRTTNLFESVWPVPEGVSYNSYLIGDEKTALMDAVEDSFCEPFFSNIEKVTDLTEIDYLVVHHMEPDHTGSIAPLRKIAPNVEIVGTKKTKEMLKKFYGITENIRTVEEGDIVDLGDRQLKFFETPFIHWPETMMSLDTKENILFSGDAFGGFGSLNGDILDENASLEFYEDEVLRYFSNIVGMYSAPTKAAIKKLKEVDINIVAPTHGLIWKAHPERIIQLYRDWSRMKAKEGVTLIYGSMYGQTRKVMEEVAKGVKASDCKDLKVMDAARTHVSYLLSEAWRRKGIIIGSPTYDARIFPPVAQFMNIVKRKKLKDRIAGVFGSYGWTGGAVRQIKSSFKGLDWELVEPIVEFGGAPTERELKQGKQLGKVIGNQVSENTT